MKTALYVCDWMGILGGLGGLISAIVEKNVEVAAWAFAATIWATAALVKDYTYYNQ